MLAVCLFSLFCVATTVAVDQSQFIPEVQFVNGSRSVNNTEESALLLTNGAPETSKSVLSPNDVRKLELSPVNYEITTSASPTDQFNNITFSNKPITDIQPATNSTQQQQLRAYSSVYVDSTNAVVARVVAPDVPAFGPGHQQGTTSRYYKPVNLLKDTDVTSIWTEWGGWTVCISSQQFRARSCYTYRGFQCPGSKVDSRKCDDITGLPIEESPKPIATSPQPALTNLPPGQNFGPPGSIFLPSANNANLPAANQAPLQQSPQSRGEFQQFQPWGSNFAPSFTNKRKWP